MRYFALFLMIASLALFGFGCGKADQPAVDPSPAVTPDIMDDPDAPESPAAEPAAEAEAGKEKAAEGEAKEGSSE